MIFFRSDYSLGGHPKIMEALMAANMEHTDGYGDDRFSYETADMIREMIGQPDAQVHFMTGGTPTNTITIAAALRPYEGVISADAGHIFVHETGSVEATGHRVFALPTPDGKLRPADIEKALLHHEDEHTVIPKMVYVTHPTENGGLYTKAEFKALDAGFKPLRIAHAEILKRRRLPLIVPRRVALIIFPVDANHRPHMPVVGIAGRVPDIAQAFDAQLLKRVFI